MIPVLIGGKKMNEVEKQAKEIVGFLRIDDRVEHKPAELSGGEKYRVSDRSMLTGLSSIDNFI